MSGVMTLLQRLIAPFRDLLLDFRDRRAAVFQSDQTWLAVLGGGAAAMVAALPIVSALSGFVIHVPYVQMVLYGGLPLLALAVLLYLVSSRIQSSSTDNAILVDNATAPSRYRFPQAQRITAKVLVWPVLAVFVVELVAVMPNGIANRKYVAGYVCSLAEGTPVHGSVQVLDMNGDITSKSIESLDDHGFFVSDLRPAGFRPVALQVQSILCSTRTINLPRSRQIQTGCVNDSQPVPQQIATAMVVVDCSRKDGK